MKTSSNIGRKARFLAASALFALAGASGAKALTFNLIYSPTIDPRALAGFQAAAATWSSYFTDNVTVNLNIAFSALSPGIIGSTSSSYVGISYNSLVNHLASDAKDSTDASAVASLQARSSNSILLNHTNDDTYGSNSATPYVDNNNSSNNYYIETTTANAKALGYSVSATSDASITFSSNFSFDFNPNDGITAGQMDFVGVATHEIGHALGFVSGADTVDYYGYNYPGSYSSDQVGYASVLDLYRFSSLSVQSNSIDLTADTRTKYFSLDNGATSIATFSTGVYYGDGRQDSHWKDNLGIGIMDPTAGYGEKLSVSATDLMAFDAIGWDLATTPSPTAVPEPSTYGLLGCASLAGLVGLRRLRRKKSQ